MLIANVVIEQTAYSFDKPYGYRVPDEMRPFAKVGCRVLVPFGRADQSRQGLIIGFEESEGAVSYKCILSVIDSEPILSEELVEMCKWMHESLFCTYFDAVKAALPVGVSFKVDELYSKGSVPFDEYSSEFNDFFASRPSASKQTLLDSFDFLSDTQIKSLVQRGCLIKTASAVRRMSDATQKSARPLIGYDELENIILTDKQRHVAELIFELGNVSVKEIEYFTGVSVSVINTLAKKGVIELFDKSVYRTPDYSKLYLRDYEIDLTEEQGGAFNKLLELYKANKPAASLLYGVTGSGKTSVFLKLCKKAVDEGKGAIVMVPEISLTPQTVARFGKLFGDKIAVFHSAMSVGQRMDEFKRVKNGEALIAIGTRSAIFAPVKNLSLIIIDEEQEHTYKSEKSPRFHARDLAKFRANYNNALLLLASATPALETYASALSGKYSLFKLSKRYGTANLPEVITVDMRKELVGGNTSSLSRTLNEAVNDALNNKKQAIILLNRRGHNTYISCPACGYIATCPNCSVSLTYHSANNRLMCHYCGHSETANKQCPSCNGGKLRFLGAGTQRVEEELRVTFPDAKILRMDADSTVSRGSYSENLDAFARGEYDIMLGTQMVAKGLDFPNVTVVGVLGADSAANSDDYRSFERSFSLLTQVLGRAGRGGDAGVAVIQTTDPDSSLINLAASQDYDTFYKQEILARKMMIYPPYCDITVIAAQSVERQSALDAITEICDKIKALVNSEFSDVKLIILGPAPAGMPKVNNRYRYRMIIKAKNSKKFRDLLKKAIQIKMDKDTSVYIDINPETII